MNGYPSVLSFGIVGVFIEGWYYAGIVKSRFARTCSSTAAAYFLGPDSVH
jgi:hypothetical protein